MDIDRHPSPKSVILMYCPVLRYSFIASTFCAYKPHVPQCLVSQTIDTNSKAGSEILARLFPSFPSPGIVNKYQYYASLFYLNTGELKSHNGWVQGVRVHSGREELEASSGEELNEDPADRMNSVESFRKLIQTRAPHLICSLGM